MAYLSKNLTVLAYANGFTMWHYVTDDAIEWVLTEGYFSPAHDMLRAGDQIVLQFRGISNQHCAGGGVLLVGHAVGETVECVVLSMVGCIHGGV